MVDLEHDGEHVRLSVRRQAFANLLLILLDQAGASRGRLSIRALATAAFELTLRDVRTMVRRLDSFAIEPRDVTLMIACPADWPFDRGAELAPFIVSPDDIALPNSDGRGICVDLQGILPGRLPGVLYDTLRLAHFRLDHCVDAAAAAYVRAHRGEFPSDPRPLLPREEERQ